MEASIGVAAVRDLFDRYRWRLGIRGSGSAPGRCDDGLMELGNCIGVKVDGQTCEPGEQRFWQRVLQQNKIARRKEEARCE